MSDQNLPLSNSEFEKLQQIVRDWIDEGLELPPFEPDVQAIRVKLGIDGDVQPPEIYPKTLEQMSAPPRPGK